MGGVVDNKGDSSLFSWLTSIQLSTGNSEISMPFFFLKARVERNRQLALARRSSVIPEKNPRRWEWFLFKTLMVIYIAMENGPFEDVYPIENGDIPLPCLPEGI